MNETGGRAISHSQDDDPLVPWELAARPMLLRLSIILKNHSDKIGARSQSKVIQFFSDFYKENELGSLLSEIQTPADGHPRVWTYEQDEINLKTFLSSWTENPHIVYLLTVMQGFVYNLSI